jgi:hypothetical protein
MEYKSIRSQQEFGSNGMLFMEMQPWKQYRPMNPSELGKLGKSIWASDNQQKFSPRIRNRN